MFTKKYLMCKVDIWKHMKAQDGPKLKLKEMFFILKDFMYSFISVFKAVL